MIKYGFLEKVINEVYTLVERQTLLGGYYVYSQDKRINRK